MPKPIYLHTLASMATMAETTVDEVQHILDAIGAQPTFVVNLTPLYGAEVLGTVVAKARGWTNLAAFHKTFFDEIEADA